MTVPSWADGDIRGVLRHVDIGLQGKSIRSHDIPIGIELKLAITGICNLTVRQLNLEKAPAVNSQIQRLISNLQIAPD